MGIGYSTNSPVKAEYFQARVENRRRLLRLKKASHILVERIIAIILNEEGFSDPPELDVRLIIALELNICAMLRRLRLIGAGRKQSRESLSYCLTPTNNRPRKKRTLVVPDH